MYGWRQQEVFHRKTLVRAQPGVEQEESSKRTPEDISQHGREGVSQTRA
jgi:hypothetical protein